MSGCRYNQSDSLCSEKSFGIPDAFETDSICSTITSLSTVVDEAARLEMLERKLRSIYQQKGVSKRKIKDLIRKKGICLKNCKEYGSITKLRRALMEQKELRIKRAKVKPYKFVSMCLIQYSKFL